MGLSLYHSTARKKTLKGLSIALIATTPAHQLILHKAVGEEVVHECGQMGWACDQHVEIFEWPERQLLVKPIGDSDTKRRLSCHDKLKLILRVGR